MAVVSRSAFARPLAGLDGEPFTNFVAHRWAARRAGACVIDRGDTVAAVSGETPIIRPVTWRSRVGLRTALALGRLDLDGVDGLVFDASTALGSF